MVFCSENGWDTLNEKWPGIFLISLSDEEPWFIRPFLEKGLLMFVLDTACNENRMKTVVRISFKIVYFSKIIMFIFVKSKSLWEWSFVWLILITKLRMQLIQLFRKYHEYY